MNVQAHYLRAGGPVPNHPRWPLLVYPSAIEINGGDPAEAFEKLFSRHRWPAAWRDGVHAYHHFHTSAHEVLGVYSGEVTVQFGGGDGIALSAKPGDVLVLPAGTGHKLVSSKGDLGIVGAYPAGQRPDGCRPDPGLGRQRALAVARVPLPEADPVHGSKGPLFKYWR